MLMGAGKDNILKEMEGWGRGGHINERKKAEVTGHLPWKPSKSEMSVWL